MIDHSETVPDTVVLIHAVRVAALSWERCLERYEGRGYRMTALVARYGR